MRHKKIKKYIGKLKSRLYIILAVIIFILISLTAYQQIRYNKLRAEIWSKIESIMDEKQLNQ